MTVTPIIIQQPTPRCPSCNGVEATKTTCRHCGYEYKDDGFGFKDAVICIGTILLLLWAAFTIMVWFIDYDRHSLVDILILQWKWFTSLRVW